MRLLHRIAPRPLVLLLLPALLLTGLLQRGTSPVVPPAPAAAPALAPDRVRPVPAPAPAAHAASPVLDATAERHLATRRPTRAGRVRARAVVQQAATPDQRGRAALAALGYDWRRLGYDVVFRAYEGGTLGTANRRTRRITVYVRRGQSELSLRASIAHELGHALDFEHGTSERREAYLRIRGVRAGTPWFPCDRCADLASPAGDFAEVFAAWLVGPGDFRSRLAGAPDRRQLAELEPLLSIPERPAGSSAAAAPEPVPSPSASPTQRGPVPAVLDPPRPRTA